MFEISSGGLRRSSSNPIPLYRQQAPRLLVAGAISVLVLLVVGQQVLLSRKYIESETLASSQVSEGIAQILQFIDEERFLDAFTR